MKKINKTIFLTSLYLIIPLFLILPKTVFSQVDSAYIIKNYKDIARKIIKAASKDSSSWERLAYMCDTFGPRFSGTENLEKALSWIEQEMKKDGLQNVKAEEVMVPHWVRGNEYCKLIEPRKAELPMLGVGGSINTPPEGITAPVLVVSNYDELYERGDEAKGKIVVYNQPFKRYGHAVRYRWAGAIEAAKFGAVASLCRSATPMSMNNPHTGSMGYNDTITKIPHAAITEEDAKMLHRMQKRGQNPVVSLYMEAKSLPDVLSHNVMGELLGREKPGEIIAGGGHIDSWDAGTGAHDDASGCLAVWEAVKLLKDLGLKPRRTIRSVMWTNEENGVRGGKAYGEKHKDEKHVLMFEFDSGVFPPSELRYTGPDSMLTIVKYFKPLLGEIAPIKVRNRGGGVDISAMVRLGVPAMSIDTDDKGTYFWYHHANTDTVDKIDPEDFNKCIATIALSLYIYADLPIELKSQLDKEDHMTN